jgi:hypothetical protein
MLQEIEANHERLATGPHMRLEFFGVTPEVHYERRGYRTVGEFTIGDGVRGYGMLRPAL